MLPAVGVMVIVSTSDEPTATSLVSKPTEDITNVDPDGTFFNVNLPSASAFTPVPVPFTVIEANGTGFPLASVTVPEMVRFWAKTSKEHSIAVTNSDANFLMWRSIFD
jgi:hypothetical protein